MQNSESRHRIYIECFDSLPGNQADLARIVNLGEPVTQSMRNKVSGKLAGAKGMGVTKSEALALQTLNLLHLILKKRGLNINDIEFDENGEISERYIASVLEVF